MKQYRNRFTADEPKKSMFTETDYEIIFKAVSDDKYRAARIFIEIARCTGLRPAEISGNKKRGYPSISATRIDHDNLTLTFLVTKTQGRQFYRKIAIPKCLSVFILNEGIRGTLPFTEAELRFQIERLRKEIGIEFTQKTFRKDFSHRMEIAGAPPDIINLHQGRGQHGVLYEHYLTDANRAVRLCRVYLDNMFGEQTEMRRVK